MTKEGSIKIGKCMTPMAGVLVIGRGHILKAIFFKYCHLYSGAWNRLFVCVSVVYVPLENFSLICPFGDVTITGEGLQILTYCRHS